MAKGVVCQRTGSALRVVDHSDLEQRAIGQHVLHDLADERNVVDHFGRDSPANVADDHRIAHAEAEEVRRIDPRIEARDHEQAQVGKHDGAFVAARTGEGPVALKRAVDAGRI
ncbi:MAG TPA: hypothetical protein VFI54_19295 [Solirubrobacteraceae bacterium]|nr:hypothetical protein [Solirubrobacteraceae bacterium]